MRRTSLGAILPLIACAAASGCGNTHRALLKLQHADLTTRITRCEEAATFLRQQPDPDRGVDVSVFVPAAALNTVLAGAVGAYPLPSANAQLKIDKLAIDGVCGSPVVTLDATAIRGSLSVRMEASIVVDVAIDPKDPTHVVVRPILNDIKPVARWGFFEFALRGFVRELIQVKLAEYAATLPVFTVPVQANFPYNIPNANQPIEFPVPSGRIFGQLRTPGLSGAVKVDTTQFLFLKDGLHAYFKVAF
jgi:hypothetical protein